MNRSIFYLQIAMLFKININLVEIWALIAIFWFVHRPNNLSCVSIFFIIYNIVFPFYYLDIFFLDTQCVQKRNIQIIKKKYIMTKIDTQERLFGPIGTVTVYLSGVYKTKYSSELRLQKIAEKHSLLNFLHIKYYIEVKYIVYWVYLVLVVSWEIVCRIIKLYIQIKFQLMQNMCKSWEIFLKNDSPTFTLGVLK